MLILEIILMIAAWRRGWRWRALVPMGVGMGLGFVIGGVIGASGGDVEDSKGLFILMDIVLIFILLFMSAWGPSAEKAEPGVDAASPEPQVNENVPLNDVLVNGEVVQH